MILLPVKKTVWGAVNSIEDLRKHVAKSGQFFGVDESGPASDFNPSYPSNQTLYQYMGWGVHKGIDIPCAEGTEIYATHDGVVTQLSEDRTAGIGIVLSMDGYKTVYWHNRENVVKLGETVKAGQLIAYSDNTGWSLGNHLHFELKKTLPNGNTDYSVGLNGALDPFLYFTENMFELRQVPGSPEVWIIKNGSRTHVYNQGVVLAIADFQSIKPITQGELDILQDTGLELATLVKE